MKKISLLVLFFSLLFCSCSKEEDDIVKLSSQETNQYSEAIAGSYEVKGFTVLVARNGFYNSDAMGKQVDVGDIFIDIDDGAERSAIFWQVPVNTLANLFPENSGVRKVLEEMEPINFSTTYSFESAVASVNGGKMVNLAFKPVPYYLKTKYDRKPHLITIDISIRGISFPYTSDMKSVRDEFLKSKIMFDVKSMKVDDEEYRNFDLMIATEIVE